MSFLTKIVPRSIKTSVSTFFRELGKLPLHLVFSHAKHMFVTTSKCDEKTKLKSTKSYIEKNKSYLYKRYGTLAKEYTKDYQAGENVFAPIWIFWWQGKDAMPELVRRCMESVQKNANKHKVVLIHKGNLSKYIQVPAFIQEKVDRGIISLTHFSDIVRMKLLADYGGIWLDATIFVSKKIEESYFQPPVFSVCNPGKDESNVSNWRWTVSVIGGNKNNTLFEATYLLLCEYWKTHDFVIDYYIFDHFINMLYESSTEIKDCINAIRPNNQDYYALQDVMEQPWTQSLSDKIFNGETIFFKLSWKKDYGKKTDTGLQTVYDYWINMMGECRGSEN